jgi:hypothetical protein
MATLQELYESGLPGAVFNPLHRERMRHIVADHGGQPDASDVAHRYGFADQFKGELIIPFVWAWHLFPGCFPGAAQGRGDCESHNAKNAALITLATEIMLAMADEVTGIIEAAPAVSEVGIRQGVLSTEALYWFARNDNRKDRFGNYLEDGWNCFEASRVLIRECGAVVRGSLGDTGLDFTKYNAELAGKYADGIPDNVRAAIKEHLFRTATECSNLEEDRDLSGKGFGILTDGDESFSGERDAHGVAERTRKGWSHAIVEGGFDDRPDTIKLYGGPLVLAGNTWGPSWNDGPRDIRDSAKYVPEKYREFWKQIGLVNPQTGNIMIPPGWFWTRALHWKNRHRIAISGANGWKRPNLPNLLGGFR